MMKSVQLALVALAFQASGIQAQQKFSRNIPVQEIGKDAKIGEKQVVYKREPCEAGWSCKEIFECEDDTTVIRLTADKKYAACCQPEQRLLGSPNTAFDCCAEGHDLAGNNQVGYHCCPTGSIWDGKQCDPPAPEPVCKGGKVLVNGKCVCPPDTIETLQGTCEEQDVEHCKSGLETGKCYTFTADGGKPLVSDVNGYYNLGPADGFHQIARLKLCKDEKCTGGLPINPSDTIYIKDILGNARNGLYPGAWLDGSRAGGHIHKTTNFAQAGKFSLSKWPCGKYCLGGIDGGISPACPAPHPGITINVRDPQVCLPVEITEVPCDAKKDENNCIWKNSVDQCCDGKMNCAH